MTLSNVKEFGEEDSTLIHATILSKNLDHLSLGFEIDHTSLQTICLVNSEA